MRRIQAFEVREVRLVVQAAIDKSVATELYKPSDFSNLEEQGRQIDMERQSEQVLSLRLFLCSDTSNCSSSKCVWQWEVHVSDATW
jgi:hypothetical protein